MPKKRRDCQPNARHADETAHGHQKSF